VHAFERRAGHQRLRARDAEQRGRFNDQKGPEALAAAQAHIAHRGEQAGRPAALAVTAEAIARFTGREPFVTLDGLRMSKYQMFFTTLKAERDLGITARPFTDALTDAIRWFRDAGYFKR